MEALIMGSGGLMAPEEMHRNIWGNHCLNPHNSTNSILNNP